MGLGGPLGHDLFGQVLANCFALAVRVSGQVNSVCFLRSRLQLGDDPLVVPLFGCRNNFIGRLEIVKDVDAEFL